MRRLGHRCKCSALLVDIPHVRRRNPSRHNPLQISRNRPCITQTGSSKNSGRSAYDIAPDIADDKLHVRGFRDARHAEWVRAFVAIMDEMKRYVLENHPTGLVWNAGVSRVPFTSFMVLNLVTGGSCFRV